MAMPSLQKLGYTISQDNIAVTAVPSHVWIYVVSWRVPQTQISKTWNAAGY